jgi:hypothetical protein
MKFCGCFSVGENNHFSNEIKRNTVATHKLHVKLMRKQQGWEVSFQDFPWLL